MSKPHWQSPESPDWMKRRLVNIRTTGGLLHLGDGYRVRSPALAWAETATAAQNAGFMYDAPTTPAHDEIAELEKTDLVAVGAARARLSLELAQEDRNAIRWSALQIWGEQDSALELAEKTRAEREERAKTDQVLERAKSIIEEERAKAFEKAKQRAAREMEATSGRS